MLYKYIVYLYIICGLLVKQVHDLFKTNYYCFITDIILLFNFVYILRRHCNVKLFILKHELLFIYLFTAQIDTYILSDDKT